MELKEIKDVFEQKKERKEEEMNKVTGKSVYEDLHRDPETNFMLNVSRLAHNMWYSISAAKTLLTKMEEINEIAKTDPMFYFEVFMRIFAKYGKVSEIFADSETYNQFLEKIDTLVNDYKLDIDSLNSKNEENLIAFYKKYFREGLADIEEFVESCKSNSQEHDLLELKTKTYKLMMAYSVFKGSKHAESGKCQEELAGEFERFKKLVFNMKKED